MTRYYCNGKKDYCDKSNDGDVVCGDCEFADGTGGKNMTCDSSTSEILSRDFSEAFVRKMKNAIEMSHHKYGWMNKTYPELAQAYKCIAERLELYQKTHNTEYLVDVANFAMIEFMHPAFPDAKYKPTDSDKSPGLAGGISYKELMEYESN